MEKGGGGEKKKKLKDCDQCHDKHSMTKKLEIKENNLCTNSRAIVFVRLTYSVTVTLHTLNTVAD